MILYHGSDCVVDAPIIMESDRFLDFKEYAELGDGANG